MRRVDRLRVDNDDVSAETGLTNACILLRIDNILLFAELTANHNAIYIDDEAMATDNTFMQMWESTARRNELTAEEKWWNLRNPDNYNYDKWSHQLTNVEDANVSSIERL